MQAKLSSSGMYLNKLEATLNIKEVDIKLLQEQLDVLTKRINHLHIENEENIQNINSLQQKNSDYLTKLQQTEELLENVMTEKQTLLTDLQTLKEENRKLNKHKEYVERKINNSVSRYKYIDQMIKLFFNIYRFCRYRTNQIQHQQYHKVLFSTVQFVIKTSVRHTI